MYVSCFICCREIAAQSKLITVSKMLFKIRNKLASNTDIVVRAVISLSVTHSSVYSG